MEFEEAVAIIKSFWREPRLPFDSNNHDEVIRLEKEFGLEFPTPLRTYLASYAPGFKFEFAAVGNPIELYQPKTMSTQLVGYNWNPVTSEKFDDWLSTWCLIGDEGADPIVIDLAIQDERCPVLQAIHGTGSWDFSLVAHSIPLYMVLVSAQHHALTGFCQWKDAIIDDENGSNLIAPSANWYFPFLKQLAPDLYPCWTDSFSNA